LSLLTRFPPTVKPLTLLLTLRYSRCCWPPPARSFRIMDLGGLLEWSLILKDLNVKYFRMCGLAEMHAPNPYAGCTLRIIFFHSIFFQSILVRTRERITMKTVISNSPHEAPEMVWTRLGRMEKRP
jgi:hypothetical protein